MTRVGDSSDLRVAVASAGMGGILRAEAHPGSAADDSIACTVSWTGQVFRAVQWDEQLLSG